jgi:hypothetical protein
MYKNKLRNTHRFFLGEGGTAGASMSTLILEYDWMYSARTISVIAIKHS